MTRYFISVTLPSLLVATVWMSFLGFWLTRKVRGYRAERQAIRAQHRAIRQAQDVLAMVISDSLTSDGVREQALPAYEALGKVLQEKKEIS